MPAESALATSAICVKPRPIADRAHTSSDCDANVADAGADRVCAAQRPISRLQIATGPPSAEQVNQAYPHHQDGETGGDGAGRNAGRYDADGAPDTADMGKQQIPALAERRERQGERADQHQQLQGRRNQYAGLRDR